MKIQNNFSYVSHVLVKNCFVANSDIDNINTAIIQNTFNCYVLHYRVTD